MLIFLKMSANALPWKDMQAAAEARLMLLSRVTPKLPSPPLCGRPGGGGYWPEIPEGGKLMNTCSTTFLIRLLGMCRHIPSTERLTPTFASSC